MRILSGVEIGLLSREEGGPQISTLETIDTQYRRALTWEGKPEQWISGGSAELLTSGVSWKID